MTLTANQETAIYNFLDLVQLLRQQTDCDVDEIGYGALYATAIVVLAIDRARDKDFTIGAISREQRRRIMTAIILALPSVLDAISKAEELGAAKEAAKEAITRGVMS